MESRSFKNDFILTAVCFIIYFSLVILANFLSEEIVKLPDSMNALFGVLFAVGLLMYLKKKKLLSYFGLKDLKELKDKSLLYCIPMLLIPLVGFVQGIELQYSGVQLVLIMISSLAIGFSEEILFRSFLIRTIEHKSKIAAWIIAGVFFGVLHLTNLFSGQEVLPVLIQVIYASSFGLMCSIFFVKTGNVLLCIICHMLTDVFYVFLPQEAPELLQYIANGLIIFLSSFYFIYLLKMLKMEKKR